MIPFQHPSAAAASGPAPDRCSTAFQHLGSTPITTVCHGTEAEAAVFVLSQNLHRRHLTKEQKAFALGAYRGMFKAVAKARQDAGREKSHQSRRGGLVPANLQEPTNTSPPQDIPAVLASAPSRAHTGEWVEAAAKEAGVSPRMMYKFRTS